MYLLNVLALLVFNILAALKSIWAFAALIPSFDFWTVFLYSSKFTCPYFHLLYASFLCLSLVINASLLAFFLEALLLSLEEATLEH